MSTLLRMIFHQEVPPMPEPKVHLPDETEIRWAKLKTESMKRRARELQIEVDIANDSKSRKYNNNLDCN